MTVRIFTITIKYFTNTGSKQENLDFVLSHSPLHPSPNDDVLILKNIYMTAVRRPLLPKEEILFESTWQSFYTVLGSTCRSDLSVKQFQCQRKIIELFSLFEIFLVEPAPLLNTLFLFDDASTQFERMCIFSKIFFSAEIL